MAVPGAGDSVDSRDLFALHRIPVKYLTSLGRSPGTCCDCAGFTPPNNSSPAVTQDRSKGRRHRERNPEEGDDGIATGPGSSRVSAPEREVGSALLGRAATVQGEPQPEHRGV